MAGSASLRGRRVAAGTEHESAASLVGNPSLVLAVTTAVRISVVVAVPTLAVSITVMISVAVLILVRFAVSFLVVLAFLLVCGLPSSSVISARPGVAVRPRCPPVAPTASRPRCQAF